MQKGLYVLHDYCKKWKLTLNVAKTKVMVFGWKSYLSKPVFKYNGEELDIVDEFTYLGVLLQSNKGWQSQEKCMSGKGLKCLNIMCRYTYKYRLNLSNLLALFDILVEPVLNYGAEVWGFYNAPQVERVHLKFLKGCLHLKSSTRNEMVYGETGRVPMIFVRYIKIIRFWLKLSDKKRANLCCIVYRQDVCKALSWGQQVKSYYVN